ncbi:dickkopf-related protein 4 [Fukomys damarensis]|uniref:dickkopf-related protein 4 n=1 Tax=Fukomys damarensis TaxID=885580 RepID=UPI0014556617|nr:dickkopf-related protein 4 [Fukomys damarensis]
MGTGHRTLCATDPKIRRNRGLSQATVSESGRPQSLCSGHSVWLNAVESGSLYLPTPGGSSMLNHTVQFSSAFRQAHHSTGESQVGPQLHTVPCMHRWRAVSRPPESRCAALTTRGRAGRQRLPPLAFAVSRGSAALVSGLFHRVRPTRLMTSLSAVSVRTDLSALGLARSEAQGSPCASDQDCSTRRFCLAPREEQPFCAVCRGLRRRCQRSAMCCPGTLCMNDICTTMEDAIPVLESRTDDPDGLDATGATEQPVENKAKGKPNIKKSQGSKGQEGESCLRTSDCGSGLCCARHFWTKICKPVLVEGQVCSRRGHKDTAQAPEIFQRCDCGPGLSCQSQGSQQHARLRVCQKVEKAVNISA